MLAAVMLAALFFAAAIALDLARVQLAETELRSAIDAATRAGTDAIARGECADQVRCEIVSIALANEVAGEPLRIADSDIQIGRATPDASGKYRFVDGATPYNSVRVFARRSSDLGSNPISPILGQLFGQSGYSIERPSAAVVEDRDIALVVDRSSSMGGDDGGIHPATGEQLRRIDALKFSVMLFRQVLDSTQGTEGLGLAQYDRDSQTAASLDINYRAFDEAIQAMTLGSGTNIGAGIDEGFQILRNHRPGATPVMIVMTDGQHNQDRDPVNATIDARQALPQLSVHSVTFSPSADGVRMMQVADEGGGSYHHAADFSELSAVFEELARSAGVRTIE